MLDNLPASCCPTVEGFGFDTSQGVISSKISAGAPRFQLWTTDTVAGYTLNFKLKYWQYRIFCNFYYNTLQNGSKWFTADLTLNDPQNKQTLELHFTQDSTLNPRQIGKDFFSVSMNVIARNPSFDDDGDFLDDLDDLIGGGYTPEEISALLDALEIYNQYLPTWYS